MAQSAVGIGDGISEDELGDGDDDDEHPEEHDDARKTAERQRRAADDEQCSQRDALQAMALVIEKAPGDVKGDGGVVDMRLCAAFGGGGCWRGLFFADEIV